MIADRNDEYTLFGFFITPCLALASDVQQLMLTMIACLQDSFVALEIVLSNSSIGSD